MQLIGYVTVPQAPQLRGWGLARAAQFTWQRTGARRLRCMSGCWRGGEQRLEVGDRQSMDSFDVIVIGGGIVGLATAYGLSGQYPGKKIAVVEKEAGLARHQTGHNSGVLHSGIYYKPGSMKAATCRAGREAMIAFCDQEGIAYDLCGKVIVAVDEAELGRLEGLVRRGTDNGVSCELVSRARLRDLEPTPPASGVSSSTTPASWTTNRSAQSW